MCRGVLACGGWPEENLRCCCLWTVPFLWQYRLLVDLYSEPSSLLFTSTLLGAGAGEWVSSAPAFTGWVFAEFQIETRGLVCASRCHCAVCHARSLDITVFHSVEKPAHPDFLCPSVHTLSLKALLLHVQNCSKVCMKLVPPKTSFPWARFPPAGSSPLSSCSLGPRIKTVLLLTAVPVI